MRAWIYDHALHIAGVVAGVVSTVLAAAFPEPWSLYLAMAFGGAL